MPDDPKHKAARRAVKTAQKQFDRDALPPRRAWLKLVLDAYVIREMAIPMLLRPENPRHNRNQPSRSHLGSSGVPRRRIECLPTGTHGRRLNPISEAS
jgi:hypothetical protein